MGFFRKASSTAAAAAQNHDSSPLEEEECIYNNLQAGDHVFRWTALLIYPIQIHGIVLSAGAGIVTIIDFGLSSGPHWSKDNRILELAREKRNCRMNIITLTEKKEVEQWHKVNYGESLLSDGKWAKIKRWFRKKRQEKQCSVPTAEALLMNSAEGVMRSNVDDETESNYSASSERLSVSSESTSPPPDEVFAEVLAWLQQEQQQKSVDYDNENNEKKGLSAANLFDEQERTDSTTYDDSKCRDNPSGELRQESNRGRSRPKNKRKAPTSPRLPKSDSPVIVLSRVRYLLSEGGESALPPHHLLFANSECIAVWCKTGRFSTIQSQILLHSTALGNAKTATMLALMVSAQTVTVTSTVQSAGFWGWLGYTTTTTSQVGLIAANPWLVPLLAGYGIAAVGTPYLILHQAQTKWEKATKELNTAFCQRAAADVCVNAIEHWSGMR